MCTWPSDVLCLRQRSNVIPGPTSTLRLSAIGWRWSNERVEGCEAWALLAPVWNAESRTSHISLVTHDLHYPRSCLMRSDHRHGELTMTQAASIIEGIALPIVRKSLGEEGRRPESDCN